MMRRFSPYDAIAEEYYDAVQHPTCANFRSLSSAFLEKLRTNEAFDKKLRIASILETGAARSLVAEALSEFDLNLSNLTIQDDSEKMLAHSLRWQNAVRDIFVSDARRLPSQDRSFEMIFSFLADPYNDEQLWSEVKRVLADDGFWIVTLPSHRWSKAFRKASGLKVSRFLTKSGEEFDLPSITYPVGEFVRSLERRGFLLRNFVNYTTDHLSGHVSKKLYANGSDSSVLDCYLFQTVSD